MRLDLIERDAEWVELGMRRPPGIEVAGGSSEVHHLVGRRLNEQWVIVKVPEY
jgi:hypothetical protein